ncbi:HNH endonuclease [Sphingomonas paucimobilis]|uniref:HNH endonuclease n=1 Tax=Sphingomonas paucimobilis TaxID=13689 RepID=UPI0031CE9D1D
MTNKSLTKEAAISAERAREILSYDPETGIITWKLRDKQGKRNNVFNAQYGGKQAGKPNVTGYGSIKLDGYDCASHRVAFLLHYGRWPTADIDHKDGDKSNNRIANLREATRAENNLNRSRYKRNKSGRAGVVERAPGKWDAQISRSGKSYRLGRFDTFEAACAARDAAEADLFGAWSRETR